MYLYKPLNFFFSGVLFYFRIPWIFFEVLIPGFKKNPMLLKFLVGWDLLQKVTSGGTSVSSGRCKFLQSFIIMLKSLKTVYSSKLSSSRAFCYQQLGYLRFSAGNLRCVLIGTSSGRFWRNWGVKEPLTSPPVNYCTWNFANSKFKANLQNCLS